MYKLGKYRIFKQKLSIKRSLNIEKEIFMHEFVSLIPNNREKKRVTALLCMSAFFYVGKRHT